MRRDNQSSRQQEATSSNHPATSSQRRVSGSSFDSSADDDTYASLFSSSSTTASSQATSFSSRSHFSSRSSGRASGRGPRCPRHASASTDACSCLVTPAGAADGQSTSEARRTSASTRTALPPVAEFPTPSVRFRLVPDPLAVLPPTSQRLYSELVENETAHVQLAHELVTMRLNQGCELVPGEKCTHRPESDETFASSVLRQARSVVNRFYFSNGSSGPVPNYASEAPTQVTSRNVVVFFQKTGRDDLPNEQRTRRRVSAWATMWRAHVRDMMAQGGEVEACPAVPVIEVRASGEFYLTLIVDTGEAAFAMEEMIKVGDTNSMEGLCRLRNASMYLNSWKRDVYEPWIQDITRRAQIVVKLEPDD